MNNKEVLKRQKDLLLEIDLLKLKREKAEKCIADIKAECLNVSSILKIS